MNRRRLLFTLLSALSVALLSIPFLIPHCGLFSLVGLVPLLCLEHIAAQEGIKHVWVWHYGTFVLWNAVTTFWVCNATVGGGLFAIFANALQMSLIFGIFRSSRKVFRGVLPYLFLMSLWIAWEYWYLQSAEISWPWLVLGNSFSGTTSLVQWYEYTGVLGGSLWVWACNLSVFGLMVSLSDGRIASWNNKARLSALAGLLALFVAVPAVSLAIFWTYEETDDSLETLVVQPDFDPYHKFESMSQEEQDLVLLDLVAGAIPDRDSTKEGYQPSGKPLLVVAPETFTSGMWTERIGENATYTRFCSFLADYPDVNILFGASTHSLCTKDGSIYSGEEAPELLCRPMYGGTWYESHNSALATDASRREEIYHKSKLVIGTELTPYPAFFVPLDNWLGRTFFDSENGIMARCSGQDAVSLLNCRSYSEDGCVKEEIKVGSVICYESVYGDYCADYVRAGARVLAVITNDAWWGDTPGYMQHLRLSCLRAIETRRSVIRSANTGISAIINQRGDIVEQTEWWTPAVIRATANLNSSLTFYAVYGDIIGRICGFSAIMLLLALIVRRIAGRKSA